MLRTECSESGLHLISTSGMPRSCAREAVERGRLKSQNNNTPNYLSELAGLSLFFLYLIFGIKQLVENGEIHPIKLWDLWCLSQYGIWALFLGLSPLSPIYRHTAGAKLNSGIAISTEARIWFLPGKYGDDEGCSLITPSSCTKKRAMSCAIVCFGISWRIRSWYAPSEIRLKPRRMGSSGLLRQKKNRNETGLTSLVRARKPKKYWNIFPPRSHSSSASKTTTDSRTHGGTSVISESDWRIKFLELVFQSPFGNRQVDINCFLYAGNQLWYMVHHAAIAFALSWRKR